MQCLPLNGDFLIKKVHDATSMDGKILPKDEVR